MPSYLEGCVARLNLNEAWWLLRRRALEGVDFADGYDVDKVRRVASRHLNRKSGPWARGGPPKPSTRSSRSSLG
jgi:hypothetical protein